MSRAEARASRSLSPAPALESVDTPAVLVDLAVLEDNVRRVAVEARQRDVALWPHAKTHKSALVAQLQLEWGAAGITVAKLDEADGLIHASGVEDVFVCYPISSDAKISRLIALTDSARISTIVEDERGARRLDEAARAAGKRLEVMVDVDTGLHRVGVEPGPKLEALVGLVRHCDGLDLAGLSTHEGYVYGIADPSERAAIVKQRTASLVSAAHALGISRISVGATPTLFETISVPGVTDARPGNYVFHDAMQVGLGVVSVEDCALTVLATVVSHRSRHEAIVDAGSKALSSDVGAHGTSLLPGFGIVKGRPDILVTKLSEEHGWLQLEPDGPGVEVGQALEIIPNHACATIANFDTALLVRGGAAVEEMFVTTRGGFR